VALIVSTPSDIDVLHLPIVLPLLLYGVAYSLLVGIIAPISCSRNRK
jgi:hypothetical protein